MIKKRVTSKRVMKAVKNTGGILKRICGNLGCSYSALHNALKNDGEEWDEVRKAIKLESEKLGDIAEETVVETMCQRLDIGVASNTARWYLERKHQERGYKKKSELTLEGGMNPLQLQNHTLLPIGELDLPIEVKRQIMEAMDKYNEKMKQKKEE